MSKNVKVGIFAFVSFLIFVILVFEIGNLKFFIKKSGYILYARFSQTAGLLEGASVRLAGVKIGIVKDIYLKQGMAEVEMIIKKDVLIRKGSKAAVSSVGLMGEKYVEIIPSKDNIEFLKEGDYLETITPLSMDQLGSLFYSIGENLKAVGDTLKDTFTSKEGESRLKSILINVSESMKEIKDTVDKLGVLIPDELSKNLEDLRKISETLLAISKKTEKIATRVDNFFDKNSDDFQETLNTIYSLNEDVKKLSSNIAKISEYVEKGKGNLGKFVKDEKLYDDIKGAVSSAKEIVKKVDSMLLQTEEIKTTFSTDVSHIDSNYRPRIGFTIEKGERFGEFSLIEEPEDQNKYYTALVGAKEGKIGAGLGIIDSELGFSLNYYPADSLSLKLYMFNFKDKDNILYRLESNYFFYKNFHFTLGVERKFSKTRFYFGVGFNN